MLLLSPHHHPSRTRWNHWDPRTLSVLCGWSLPKTRPDRTWGGGDEPWPPVPFFSRENTLHSIGKAIPVGVFLFLDPWICCLLGGALNLPNRWQERVPEHQLLNFSLQLHFLGPWNFHSSCTGCGCIPVNDYLYCIMNGLLCIYLYMIRYIVEIPCEHDQRRGFHITGEGIPVLLTGAMIHFRTNSYTPDWDAPSHSRQYQENGSWVRARTLSIPKWMWDKGWLHGWNLRFMSVWPAIKTLAQRNENPKKRGVTAEPKFDSSLNLFSLEGSYGSKATSAVFI